MLAQISDPHIGSAEGGDPERDLADAVRALAALRPRPDAVLLSGDLAEHGLPAEYARVRALLEPLPMPVLPLPGNHDDRAALRAAFPPPGEADAAPDAPSRDVATCGDLRLVVCDSTLPGRADGALDAEHRGWLDRRLAEAPQTPTIVAMHHPPLLTGMPAFDALGLAPGDRAALADQLRRWPQVRRVVAGHVHCASVAQLGGCVVATSPSTWRVHPRMRLGADDFELVEGPAGYALHAVIDGDVVSHVQSIERDPA